MKRSARVLFGSLLGAFAILGCRDQKAREFEAEVMALDRAIDGVRSAPNPAKTAKLGELERAACKAPEVCALKRLCVEAYAKHLSALTATERARTLLASPDGGTRASLEAAAELTRAERDLVESKTLTARCATDQGELRRKAKPH